MRFASYNLLHGVSMRSGSIDLQAAAEAIACLDADVVAVQEVDRAQPRSHEVDQVTALATRLDAFGVFAPALLGSPDTSWRLPAGAPGHIGAPADDQRTGRDPAYGVGLISRRPLRRVTRTVLPGGGDGQRRRPGSPGNPGWDREPRASLAADVELDGMAVRVATTHLSYLPWRALAQLRAALAATATDSRPALLLGDLNLPAGPVRALLDAARQRAGSPRSGWRHLGGEPTYPAWRPRLQLDQALATHAFPRAAVSSGGPSTSDHVPFSVTVPPTSVTVAPGSADAP
jgi:endonuclease/exonuclease/phosphatase family metal-dependent hydrolase